MQIDENLDDDWIGGNSDQVTSGFDQKIALNKKTQPDQIKNVEHEESSKQDHKDYHFSNQSSNEDKKEDSKPSFIQELIPKKSELKSKPISDLLVGEEPPKIAENVNEPSVELSKSKKTIESNVKTDLKNKNKNQVKLNNPGINTTFTSFYDKIPIDNIAIGIGIDRGVFTAILIQNLNGVKTLLAHHIQYAKVKDLSCDKSPNDFRVECSKLLQGLADNFPKELKKFFLSIGA